MGIVFIVFGAASAEAQLVNKGYATSLVLDEPILPGSNRRITGSGAPNLPTAWVELWRVPAGSLRAESVTSVSAFNGNFVFQGVDVTEGDDFYVTLSRSWQFETPGDFEGWSHADDSQDVQLEVAGGALRVTLMDGNGDGFRDGYVLNFVSYDPSLYRVVEVRLRNVAPAQPTDTFSVFWGSPFVTTVSVHQAKMPVEMPAFETLQFPMNVGEISVVPGPIETDVDGLWATGNLNDVLRLDPWDGMSPGDGSLDGMTFEIDWIRLREDFRLDFNADGDPMGLGGANGTNGVAVFGGVLEYEVAGQASIFHDVFTGLVEVDHFTHLAVGLADPIAAIEDNSLALVFDDPLAGVRQQAEVAVQLSGRQDVFARIDDATVPAGGWTGAGRVSTLDLELEMPTAGTAGDLMRIDYIALVPANPWGPSDPVLAASPNNRPIAAIINHPDPATVELAGGRASVLFDGSSSDDGDGGTQGLSFFWEKVDGPEGDSIEAPDAPATAVDVTEPGEYLYRLVVDDGALVDSTDSADVVVTVTAPPEVRFLRGDADGDSRAMTVRDAVAIIKTLCKHRRKQEPLACLDAADVDDNGAIEFDDAIYILKYRFCGTVPPPPPPFPECGEDPTADELPECSYDDSLCGSVTVAEARSPKERRRARRQRHRGRRI